MCNLTVVEDSFLFSLPACNLIYAAAGIFIKRNVVSFDKLGIFVLDVEAVIFCVMFAGFGAVISEILDIFKSYHVAVFFGCILFSGSSADFGIEVVAVLIPISRSQPMWFMPAISSFLPSSLSSMPSLLRRSFEQD